MLSAGRSDSSKNISSKAARDHQSEQPAATGTSQDVVACSVWHEECLEGPRQLTDAFLTWIRPGPYAAADRARRPGR